KGFVWHPARRNKKCSNKAPSDKGSDIWQHHGGQMTSEGLHIGSHVCFHVMFLLVCFYYV
ncbi:hypothetical protein D049_1483B, partial [Vibrio parahaemolyticus VPTS-2010]